MDLINALFVLSRMALHHYLPTHPVVNDARLCGIPWMVRVAGRRKMQDVLCHFLGDPAALEGVARAQKRVALPAVRLSHEKMAPTMCGSLYHVLGIVDVGHTLWPYFRSFSAVRRVDIRHMASVAM